MKGYLEQKGTPTPDKPVEIKSKLIGKNLFETYEVNGRTYTGNLPKNAFISIPNKQYIEYEQQKEEIERLNNKLKDIKSQLDYLETYSSKEDVFEDMKGRLDRINKIIGSDKE